MSEFLRAVFGFNRPSWWILTLWLALTVLFPSALIIDAAGIGPGSRLLILLGLGGAIGIYTSLSNWDEREYEKREQARNDQHSW